MPSDFTWADAVLLGIDITAWIVAAVILAGCAITLVLALCAAAGQADRSLEIARERKARAAHGGAVPADDWGADDIYPERKAS